MHISRCTSASAHLLKGWSTRGACGRRSGVLANASLHCRAVFNKLSLTSQSNNIGQRQLTTSPRRRVRRISTLDPTRLTSSDWINLSGGCYPKVYVKSDTELEVVDGLYYCSPIHRYPPHARGFLYYHPPNSDVFAPEFNQFNAGHLRFHCTNSPTDAFQTGEDLTLPTRAPWHCTGASFLNMKRRPLLNLALREGLLTDLEVAAWHKHPGAHANTIPSTCIYRFDQPFVLNLTAAQNYVRFAPTGVWREENDRYLGIITGVRAKWMESFRGSNPYTLVPCFTSGHIVCHFEAPLESLDDNGNPGRVVLRVDRILEPAVQVPSLPISVPPPAPGELLVLPCAKMDGSPRQYRLRFRHWSIDLTLARSERFARIVHASYANWRKGGAAQS